MFLVSVTDTAGNPLQINGAAIAYYLRDKAGKASVIHLSTAIAGALTTLTVAEAPETITTQIQAKLRK